MKRVDIKKTSFNQLDLVRERFRGFVMGLDGKKSKKEENVFYVNKTEYTQLCKEGDIIDNNGESIIEMYGYKIIIKKSKAGFIIYH